MQNGHLLIAKEKDPAAFVEFGPEGDEPSGFGPESALKAGARWPSVDGDHVFVPLAVWNPSVKLAGLLRGLQRPRGRTRPAALPAQRQVRSRSPGSGTWSSAIRVARADEVWELPTLDGKPEGLALTRNGRAIVALDTKLAKENLVLLEPPIAEGATS